jgi:hypothetical protein
LISPGNTSPWLVISSVAMIITPPEWNSVFYFKCSFYRRCGSFEVT